MKKPILLIAALMASVASFAQVTPNTDTPAEAVFVSVTNQKLNLYVQPESTSAQISMRDEQGRLIYTDTVSLKKGLRQKFDLSQLETGTYHFTLVKDGKAIDKTFSIQEKPAEKVVTVES